jgi:hypothetical protein
MQIILRLFLISFVIVLIESCISHHNNPEEIDITYTSVDSITIESTDIVQFLSYDLIKDQFLFIEKSKNELILYNHKDKMTQNLAHLKEKFPVMNDLHHHRPPVQ